MLVTLSGFEILLDRSGACIVPKHGIVVFNQIPWRLSLRELFPDHGPTAQLKDDIARICAEHRPKIAVLVGKVAPPDPEGLESFLKESGLEPIWVGADPATVPDGSNLFDEFEVDGLAITCQLSVNPTIVGGFSPGDSGGRCFLMNGDKLILPDLSSLSVSIPEDTPTRCQAIWLGRSGLVSSPFEWLNHSLR